MKSNNFGNRNKHKFPYKVILPWVIEINIVTDFVALDILLLSKDAIKRVWTCLNFENDSATIIRRKIPMKYTSSG